MFSCYFQYQFETHYSFLILPILIILCVFSLLIDTCMAYVPSWHRCTWLKIRRGVPGGAKIIGGSMLFGQNFKGGGVFLFLLHLYKQVFQKFAWGSYVIPPLTPLTPCSHMFHWHLVFVRNYTYTTAVDEKKTVPHCSKLNMQTGMKEQST